MTDLPLQLQSQCEIFQYTIYIYVDDKWLPFYLSLTHPKMAPQNDSCLRCWFLAFSAFQMALEWPTPPITLNIYPCWIFLIPTGLSILLFKSTLLPLSLFTLTVPPSSWSPRLLLGKKMAFLIFSTALHLIHLRMTSRAIFLLAHLHGFGNWN